jgi:thiol-disulfide isomerase/thioredoxin
MKKIFIGILLALPFPGEAQQQYTLRATIPALSDGTMVFLISSKQSTSFRDSAIIKKGIVDFKGSIPEPSKAVLRTEQRGAITDIVHFYLEPAALQMKSPDSLHNARVTNSLLNKEFYAFQQQNGHYIQQMVALRMKAMKMTKEAIAGEEGIAMNKQGRMLADSLRAKQKAFIQTHPASFMSLELLGTYAGMYIDAREIIPLFDKLSPKIRSTPTAIAFAKLLTKAETIKIGNRAPLFVTNTPAGDSISLKQVLAQSKWVLVDFWASWCSPCRAENPHVVKAYQQFHDKGFNIISISLDRSAALWKQAIEKDNMPWYHGSSLKGPGDTTAELYGVGAIPDNFLVDARGVIIARALRGKALEEKLAELFSY